MNVCKRHVLICSKHIHLHIAIDVKTKTRDYIELIKAIHESAMPLGSTPRHLVKLIKMWDVI